MTNGLRKWQKEALARIDGVSETYVIEACPGAGKTRLAIEAAKKLRNEGLVDNVIWVVPSLHLVQQTSNAAIDADLVIRAWGNREVAPPADSVGRVVTYQQVAAAPLVYQGKSNSTLVILDEVHHVGGQNAWGQQVKNAFQDSRFKLLMTGTPWREDGSAIPFVSYDRNGELCVDYSYSLAVAWSEKPPPVRGVRFHHLKAIGNWKDQNGTYREVAGEEADEDEEGKLLASFHNPKSEWVEWAFRKGQERLAKIKESNTDAQGLILARDQWHADQYAEECEAFGMSCEVVHLDQRDPHARLRHFQDSKTDWLIAVGMVSEGYDNSRLSVLIYASRDRTALAFHQAMGRITRKPPGDTTRAQMIFPHTPTLAHLVENIEETQSRALKEQFEQLVPVDRLVDKESSETKVEIYPATDAEYGKTVTKGEDPVEIAMVKVLENPAALRALFEENPKLIDNVLLDQEVEEAPPLARPLTDAQRESLFQKHNRIVNRLARIEGLDHKNLWAKINSHYGHKNRRQRTDAELRDEGRLLAAWQRGEVPNWV